MEGLIDAIGFSGSTASLDGLLVLLIGVATVAAMVAKSVLERVGIPPLVGFIGIGFAFRLADLKLPLLTDPVLSAFELLGSLGVVALLFRVGLGSHPHRLLEKLPSASLIWVGNVAVSGLLGYLAARYWLDWGLAPSLVVATALTATSIGVAIPVWQDAGALDTDSGALTVDVAELDDISGVMLMALLFTVLPLLHQGNGDALIPTVIHAGTGLIARFAAFAALCYLFAHFLEPQLTNAIARWELPPGRMLTVAGLGSIIAGLAGGLGFSLAIGALFAGLIFSRAPQTVYNDRSYQILYDFLTPFFFIGIGLELEPAAIAGALTAGLALGLVAIIGKLLGTMVPALLTTTPANGVMIGISMVPRAEIAMVIMHQGRELGEWAVPDVLYGAMTVVTVVTCMVTPPLLSRLLRRSEQPRPHNTKPSA